MRTPRNYEPLRETHRQVAAEQESSAAETQAPAAQQTPVDLRSEDQIEAEAMQARAAELRAAGYTKPGEVFNQLQREDHEKEQQILQEIAHESEARDSLLEHQVLRSIDTLARNDGHGVHDYLCDAILKSDAFKNMSTEQESAFRHATSDSGLAVIDGQAGTGKGPILTAIRDAYEMHGARVIGLAPTDAVAEAMNQEGFKRATTIDAELSALNEGRTKWDARIVVVVYEAGMIDTKSMAIVTAHAAESGAKLILVGDDRQIPSVERVGDIFGGLAEGLDQAVTRPLSWIAQYLSGEGRPNPELMTAGQLDAYVTDLKNQAATVEANRPTVSEVERRQAIETNMKAEEEDTNRNRGSGSGRSGGAGR